MISECRDLSVSSVLVDPMIRALMAADGVDGAAFESFLRDKAATLREARKTSAVTMTNVIARDRSWRSRVCFA